MDLALLDTDILSDLLKQRNPCVVTRAANYLGLHGQFALSVFSRFEFTRGYQEKGATTRLVRFQEFCRHTLVVPVSDAIFDRAENLWVLARRGGYAHNDADLIIAATAMEFGRILVTGCLARFYGTGINARRAVDMSRQAPSAAVTSV